MADQFMNLKSKMPNLGIGLGLRRELASDTFANADKIDWLEFVPENYMAIGGAARKRLVKAAERFPLVSHGINLSLGSTDELNLDYLASLKDLIDQLNCPWFSDHLCFTSIDGVYMHDLLPLPFSKETVQHVANRIETVQAKIERPFLIENISFYMFMPGSDLTEAQFLSSLLEEADCGLLLDVNNVYVNSLNHKFDPYEFLDSIPLERTVQIHVAGHSTGSGVVIDTHGSTVVQPVYDLLEYVLKRTEVKAVMLERDQNFPAFSDLLAELESIRRIARSTQPALASKNRPTAAIDRLPVLVESFKGRESAEAFTA